MSDKKDEKKEKSLIDKIRALITEEDGNSKSEGTGGAQRRRKIDQVVDDAVKGADEDAKRR